MVHNSWKIRSQNVAKIHSMSVSEVERELEERRRKSRLHYPPSMQWSEESTKRKRTWQNGIAQTFLGTNILFKICLSVHQDMPSELSLSCASRWLSHLLRTNGGKGLRQLVARKTRELDRTSWLDSFFQRFTSPSHREDWFFFLSFLARVRRDEHPLTEKQIKNRLGEIAVYTLPLTFGMGIFLFESLSDLSASTTTVHALSKNDMFFLTTCERFNLSYGEWERKIPLSIHGKWGREKREGSLTSSSSSSLIPTRERERERFPPPEKSVSDDYDIWDEDKMCHGKEKKEL